MYTDPGQKPTKAQLESKEELLAGAKAVQSKALADEKALAEAPSPSAEEERDWIQQHMEYLDEMIEEHLIQEMEMELEDAAGEDEDMLDVGEEMVFAVTNENEVPMLAPLREESDTEDTDGKQTKSKRNISVADKRAIQEGMKFGATGLATPGVSRTTSGQPAAKGASRRSSRLHQHEDDNKK